MGLGTWKGSAWSTNEEKPSKGHPCPRWREYCPVAYINTAHRSQESFVQFIHSFIQFVHSIRSIHHSFIQFVQFTSLNSFNHSFIHTEELIPHDSYLTSHNLIGTHTPYNNRHRVKVNLISLLYILGYQIFASIIPNLSPMEVKGQTRELPALTDITYTALCPVLQNRLELSLLSLMSSTVFKITLCLPFAGPWAYELMEFCMEKTLVSSKWWKIYIY